MTENKISAFDEARLGTTTDKITAQAIEAEQGMQIYSDPEVVNKLFEGFTFEGDAMGYHTLTSLTTINQGDGKKAEEGIITLLVNRTGMNSKMVRDEIMQLASQFFNESYDPDTGYHHESIEVSVAQAIKKFWDSYVQNFESVKSHDSEIQSAIEDYLAQGNKIDVLPPQPATPILFEDTI